MEVTKLNYRWDYSWCTKIHGIITDNFLLTVPFAVDHTFSSKIIIQRVTSLNYTEDHCNKIMHGSTTVTDTPDHNNEKYLYKEAPQ